MNDADWRQAWSLFRDATESAEAGRTASLDSVDARIASEVRELLLEEDDELPAGEALGSFARFQIEERIGTGGMGAVYAAHDLELHRTVALKFVNDRPGHLTASVNPLVAEAQAASALNHPNIVTIYDVLRDGHRVAIAAELVEGFPLSERRRQPPPIEDLLAWGSQIANGLVAAHARGIVHGDIKPENIMVRPDGLVKILDFGLARRIEHEDLLSDVPLGTLGYMAPEQIRGEPLTGAADVFALGIVLFELAAGVHPFLAETRTATSRIITSAEPFTAAAVKPPAALGPLLHRMLARDASERPAAATLVAELDALRRRHAPARSPTTRSVLIWSAPVVLVAASALAVFVSSWTEELPRFREVPFTSYPGSETEPAFSPDGSRIAFTWAAEGSPYRHVYVKDLDEGEPRPLTSGDVNHYAPAWSPDGQRIALLRGVRGSTQDVVVLPAGGGDGSVVTSIADTGGYARPIAWWPDGGSLLVRDASPDGIRLVRVFLSGAPAVPISSPRPSEVDANITLAPDGTRIAFVRHQAGGDTALCVTPADGRPPDAATDPCDSRFANVRSLAWRRDGRGLFVSDRSALWFVALEGRRARPPVKIMEGSFAGLAGHPRSDRVAFSRTFSNLNLWRMDVAGGAPQKVAVSSTEESEPVFSPDGTELLFRSRRSGPLELWASAADGSNPVRLTSIGGHLGSAVWSPDGRFIAFDANWFAGAQNTGIYVIPATGGEARRLTDAAVAANVPGWSHDGRWVYYSTVGPRSELWKVPAEGGPPVRVSAGPMWEPAESADGRWLYYTKPHGARGIWRRPVSGGAEELLPGTEGVRTRHWLLHREGIYFITGTSELSLQLLVPANGDVRTIARIPPRIAQGPRGLAVSPDGRTIVYAQEDLTLSDILFLEPQ